MAISKELFDRQVQLEKESVSRGVERYQNALIKARKNKDVANLGPEVKLMLQNIQPLVSGLTSFCNKKQKGAGRFHSVKGFLSQMDHGVVAYLTLRRCLNAIGTRSIEHGVPLQHLAIGIAQDILVDLNYKKFKEEMPGYLKAVEENMVTTHTGHRKKVIKHLQKKKGVEEITLTVEEKLGLGIKCIEIAVQTGNLFMKSRCPSHQGKSDFHSITLRPEALEWLNQAHEICAEMSPVFLPMVSKPRPWEDHKTGGYYTLKNPLVRSRHKEVQNSVKNSDMPDVYDALNAIQDTRWRINARVLETLIEADRMGIGKLPAKDLDDIIPPPLWDNDEEFERFKAENPEEYQKWIQSRRRAHDAWNRGVSKRISLAMQISLAKKFKDEETIYIPHNLDWRGRAYPLVPFLNPQSNDTGKALLEFADGVALGEEGPFWLAVHGANVFGEDKVSFEDRVKWVEDHKDLIVDSAENPLDGERFWCKADDPFKFLAFCFEWNEYLKIGPSFESRIPIAMDGSCNGLQHYSGALLDPEGGKSVNLVPQETPADIYRDVADVAAQIVARDASNGNDEAKCWMGKIDRGIAKRNTMTTPYGAGQYGFTKQLDSEIRKKEEESGESFLGEDAPKKAVVYMAQVNKKAIGQVVKKAAEGMDFLKKCAKVSSDAVEDGIVWTTPLGFRACQVYKKTKTHRIESFFGGVRLQTNIQKDVEKSSNTVKHFNGLAPNFIHSYDATHLFMSINEMKKEGIQHFAMIHDSFGTHAGRTGALFCAIRNAFVHLYADRNIFEDFKQELGGQVDQETWMDLPDVPGRGDLDIRQVLESRYFFA